MSERKPYRVSGRQRALSWVYPIRLERSQSEFHPVLDVVLINGKLRLNGARVNYSFGLLGTAFEHAFRNVHLRARRPESVLLLGLGVGNVPAILRAEGLNPEITGVDIDPEVVRLGRKYFGLDDYSNLRVVIDDAAAFAARCTERFDMVVVDLFLEDVVPEQVEKADFLRRLGTLLHPGGLLIFNRLIHSPELAQGTGAFLETMKHALPGSRFIKADQNRMLVYEKPSS